MKKAMHHFAINSVLFLTTVRKKYVKMYERFIEELKTYSKAYINPFQRLSANIFTATIKIRKNSE